MTLHQRFWEKVNQSPGLGPKGDCWEWTAAKTPGGYGKLWNDGGLFPAHRVSWQLHNGSIPEGLCVLHKCDNRICVNPNHLFVGTDADNNRDMKEKGRAVPPPRLCGERHPNAKLTDEQVAAIRARGLSERQSDLAAEFDVRKQTIWGIVHGKRHKTRREWLAPTMTLILAGSAQARMCDWPQYGIPALARPKR